MTVLTDGIRTIAEEESIYKSLCKLQTLKKSQLIPLYVQKNEKKFERVQNRMYLMNQILLAIMRLS